MEPLLYIPEPFADMPLAPYLSPPPSARLYNDLPESFFVQVSRCDDPSQATAIVLPNNFLALTDSARAYIGQYADMAERLHKPLFIFSLGDFTDTLQFDPRAYVFRLSLYRLTKGPRDIIVPTLTEDLGAAGISIRAKGNKPTVSFCGMAGFKTRGTWLKYILRLMYWNLRASGNSLLKARKQGVYWRRAAMRACVRSPLIKTNFIVRRSFSGNRKTIELDPMLARRQFIENIIDSDFVLAPKGDGNYSNRFLEALSLGRFPVLIDTDAVLPLEDTIDYTDIVVKVPMDEIAETPRYIAEFYRRMSDVEYQMRERRARAVFEQYLRADSFFKHFFTEAIAKIAP